MTIRISPRLLGVLLLAVRTTDVVMAGTVPVPQVLPAGHEIVQFGSYPGVEVRAELGRRGVRVLAYVPPTGLLVACDSAWETRGLDVIRASTVTPADKVSREFAHDATGVYLVMFHSDVNPQVARQLSEEAGLQVLDSQNLLPGHLLVAGAWDRALTLARHDEVAHVVPPSKELLIHRPVPGCPGPISEAGVVADYTLEGAQWASTTGTSVALTFWFDGLSSHLDASVARDEVTQAFATWAQYTNLTITAGKQAGAARAIDVLFATGTHGDAYPFTSVSTLGHAFYPVPENPEPQAGDIHLNDAESWDTTGGIDLYSVALHEAGHALGLAHSSDPNSVMYAYYHKVTALTDDDIAGIQALYGKPSSSQPPAAPAPPVTPTPVPAPAPTPPSGGTDTVPPSIEIVSPGSTIVSAYAPTIAVSGTAADNVGVVSVTWTTSTGGTGEASGTTNWSATVPLLIGNTTVTIRAYDAAGNSAWRSLTVVRVN